MSDGIQQVGFNPDRRHMATAGTDGRIRLWDLQTLDQLTTWPAGG